MTSSCYSLFFNDLPRFTFTDIAILVYFNNGYKLCVDILTVENCF